MHIKRREKMPVPISFPTLIALLLLFLFVLPGLYYTKVSQKTIPPGNFAYVTPPASSVYAIPVVMPETVTCTLSFGNTFSCGLYSLIFPSGWTPTNSQGVVEFTNYDPGQAPGRDYDPKLDNNKMKFGIQIFKTREDLSGFVTKKLKENNDTILSLNQAQVHGYSAVKASYTDLGSPSPVSVMYLQNSEKTEIASLYTVFGMTDYWYNQAFLGFRFTP